MSRRRTLFILLALVAIGAGVYYGLPAEKSDKPTVNTLVDEVFKTRFKDPSGTVTTLHSYRGKVVVLNFWATWCAPCIEEMPELSELQVELVSRGVQVVGMGVDTAGKIAKFSQEVKVLYPLLVLGASGIELVQRFGNQNGSLPYTVVINRDGQIIERKVGRIDKTRMRRVILRILETGK